MRSHSILIVALLCATVFFAPTAGAKHGVESTLHTDRRATAVGGGEIDVTWYQNAEETGKHFNTCAVFIRLIGPTGISTEAIAGFGKNSEGRQDATAIIPGSGITRIEIGVAGTLTDKEFHSERSDWLMPLVNDPIHE